MLEGDYRPRPPEAPPMESGGGYTDEEPQAAFSDTAKALMAEKTLKFSSPENAYDKLLDLTAEAGAYDDMPDTVVETLHNISLAYGILAYEQLPDNMKELFLMRLDRHRENYQSDQIELSQEEALMLQKVALAATIDYDPGTEETLEKRIFPFSQAEQHPPETVSSYFPVITGRSKSPEQVSIVDSTPASSAEDRFKDW